MFKNLFHEKYIVFFYKKYINVCNCRFEIVANMSRTCYKEIHKCLQSSPTKANGVNLNELSINHHQPKSFWLIEQLIRPICEMNF